MSSHMEQKLAAFSNLVEIAAAINSSLDPDDVLPNILNMAQRVMNAAAASVAIVDEATGELVYAVATGEHGQKVKEGIRLKIGPNSIAGWVAQNGQPLVLTDVANDPRFNLAAAKNIGMIPRTMVCVPMKARGNVIGILQAIDSRHKEVFDQDDGEFFLAFANLAATAIQNARLHKAALKQQRQSQEREIARQIQLGFLPKEMPAIPGISVAGYYEPALDLGGDFYDVVQVSPTRVALLVGDVTGKGLASSLHMVRCLFGARRYASAGTSPAQALAEINDTLASESAADMAAAMAANQTPRTPIFLGLLYATLDIVTGELRYANAGMPDPILFADGKSETLGGSGGPSLGMVPGMTFGEGVRTLTGVETLLMFTDGLSEARNIGATEFGYERIGSALAAGHTTAAEAVRAVAESVMHFMGSATRHDDLTFLAMKHDTAEAAKGVPKPDIRSITIKSHPRELGQMRAFVRDTLARTPLSEETAFNMVLAVDEACANIIRHAYKNDHTQDIIIRTELTPSALEFRLRDFGKQADPASFKSRDLDHVRPGGLGCYFIAKVFDTVEYNTRFDKGTELRLVKQLA